jgi:subtilisin family serine protease
MKTISHSSLRALIVLTAFAFVLACLTDAALTKGSKARSEQKTEQVNGIDAVAGQVLVKFRSPEDPKKAALIRQAADAETDNLVGGTGTHLIQSRSKTANTLVHELSARDDVIYAEPNYIIRLESIPNDPDFPKLWGLQNVGQVVEAIRGTPGNDIGVVPAWNISTGSRGNVVAIVDTGIDYTHPDLAANVWSAPTAFTVQVGGQSITCPAGSYGFNAITLSCDPIDDNNHGTHVSGTIGAVGNNGTGIVGVNQTASLMGLKFLNEAGNGSLADALNALEFAVQVKAAFASTAGANVRVLNNSWGGDGFSQAMLDQINRAKDAEMLFVVAAGNSGRSLDTQPSFPASYTNYNASSVLSVAATNNVDGLAPFAIFAASDWGAATVHLGAPGSGADKDDNHWRTA